MTSSNEFQFFWSEGPLDWSGWLCLRSFTRYSDVTIHLYSYDRNLKLEIPKCICHDASEVFPREIYERVKNSFARTYGEAAGYRETSDLFRYKLLYEKGGWYFDTDCILIKQLTPLFDLDYVFAWETTDKVFVGTAIIKFPKNTEMLDQLYKNFVQTDPKTWQHGITFMSLFTEYLRKFDLTDKTLSPEYFYPLYWDQSTQQQSSSEDRTYIIHLWQAAPFYRELDLLRQIEALQKQIEALNNSLSLRIARKIPFGKEIRNLVAKDE